MCDARWPPVLTFPVLCYNLPVTHQDGITIKGIRQGLLVRLGDGDWEGELHALEARLRASPAFFRGGRIALDVGGRSLSPEALKAARTLLAHYEVDLWAVVGGEAETERNARRLGLVVQIPSPPAPRAADTEEAEPEPLLEGLVVRRTLRAGQRLHHPGHIVVIGDVNPGAEVVAGGDIVIWGRAWGLLHAGALGDEGAVICALDLSPTQLRIAGHIARSPEGRRRNPVPEVASVRAGQIIATPWVSAGKKSRRFWKRRD